MSVQTAFERGHQFYKLILSNWGNRGTDADVESVLYTLRNTPIAGAQIAPESDVGEVEVLFNMGQKKIPILLNDVDRRDRAENAIYLRRGQPYIFRTPAEIQIYPTFATLWGDWYFPTTPPSADPGDAAAWGRTLDEDQFTVPTLTMLLYFDMNPPILASPSMPFSEALGGSLAINDEVEHLCHFYPIQHRKRLRLYVENRSAADTVDVRVTGINGGYGRHVMPGPFGREFPLQAKTVAPKIRDMFHIIEPDATWLGVYATKQVNSGNSNVKWNLLAD